MALAWVFTTSGAKSRGGGVSLCNGSAKMLPSVVLISYGTYGCVQLHMWIGFLIVSFPFLLFYRFIHPRRSPPKEGDNVMVVPHVT